MNKKLLTIILPLIVIAGCSVEEKDCQIPLPKENKVFQAYMEEFSCGTKTALDESNKILWNENDAITILDPEGKVNKYIISEGIGTTKATFTFEKQTLPTNTAAIAPAFNIAISPFSEFYYNVESVEGTDIARKQNYVANGVDPNSMIMASITDADCNALHFKNLYSVLRLNLTGTDIIQRITVRSHGIESLCGKGHIEYIKNENEEKLNLVEKKECSSSSIVLECGEGVQLSGTPMVFNIGMMPADLDKGFEVQIESSEGKITTLKAPANPVNKLDRNIILDMPVMNITCDKEITSPAADQCWVKTTADTPPELNMTEIEGLPVMKDWTISSTVNHLGYWTYTAPEAFTMLDNKEAPLFENNTMLTEVVLPEEMKYIPAAFFKGCTALEKITLPESLESLQGNGIFEKTALTSLIIPGKTECRNVSDLFRNCKALHEVTIHSPAFGGNRVFSGCDKLNQIRFLAKNLTLTVNPNEDIFYDFRTEEVNLTIHTDCSIQPTDAVTWNGKKWFSITYVDDNGNVVKRTGATPIDAPDWDSESGQKEWF